MKKLLILLPVLMLATGCVQQGWVLTDSKNRTVVGEHIQVTFPKGWMQTKLPAEAPVYNKKNKVIPMETLSSSREGTGLHSIIAAKRFNKFAFPSIEKNLRPDMLPIEVADLYVSDLRKQKGLERLKVISNKPALVGKKRGFRVVSQFKNGDGLRIVIDTFGFVDDTGFYLITYKGPRLYYYQRDLPAFVASAKSFRRLKNATGEFKASGLAGLFVAK